METIKVFEIAGKNAISMQNGNKLYIKLMDFINKFNQFELDFKDVVLFASPFFNASFGLVLKDVDVEDLQKKILIINLNEVGRELLNHVIANALDFYRNSSSVSKVMDDKQEHGGFDE